MHAVVDPGPVERGEHLERRAGLVDQGARGDRVRGSGRGSARRPASARAAATRSSRRRPYGPKSAAVCTRAAPTSLRDPRHDVLGLAAHDAEPRAAATAQIGVQGVQRGVQPGRRAVPAPRSRTGSSTNSGRRGAVVQGGAQRRVVRQPEVSTHPPDGGVGSGTHVLPLHGSRRVQRLPICGSQQWTGAVRRRHKQRERPDRHDRDVPADDLRARGGGHSPSSCPDRRAVASERSDGVADRGPDGTRQPRPRAGGPPPRAVRGGPRPRHPGDAQAPARRAAADRRDRPRLGAGPRRGLSLGARHLRGRRAEARRPAARTDRVAVRQPHPRHGRARGESAGGRLPGRQRAPRRGRPRLR